MSRYSESGRSMLEMIGVIALITLLGMGALVGYQQTISSHQATTLHEDILVQAQSKKGQNYRGKTTYDSGIGNKTRTGLDMQTPDNNDGETFSVIVKNVSSDMCKYLAKKDWKDAVRIKVDDNAYTANNIDCAPVKNSGNENFDLEVIFPKKASTLGVFQRTCDQCMSCERCDTDKNICINNCPSTRQACIENTCITRQICEEGQDAHGNSCQDCSPNSITACSGCADRYATRPYWNGTQCVCYSDSCGAGYFCKTTGECDDCPAHAECPDGLIECIEGYYQSGESCSECSTDGSETCETCPSATPYWDGETCVSAICPSNSSTTETSEEIEDTGCYCVAGYIVNAAGNGCVAETSCTSDADCGDGYYCHPTTHRCAVNTCLNIPNSSPIVNGTQIGTTGCYCVAGYIVNATGNGCMEDTPNCPEKTTWDGTGTAATALENGHCICTSYSENQCGTGYYCHITDYTTSGSCDADNENYYTSVTGKCQPITDVVTPTTEELTILTAAGFPNSIVRSTTKMNWWSAYSWCMGQGKHLIDVEDMECYNNGSTTDMAAEGKANSMSCCKPGEKCLQGFGNTSLWSGKIPISGKESEIAKYSDQMIALRKVYGATYFWTRSSYFNASPSSCHAFDVFTDSSIVDGYGRTYSSLVDGYGRSYNSYALCGKRTSGGECPAHSALVGTSDKKIGDTPCYCREGYVVNAAGTGCVAETPCSSDTDCEDGYYCDPTSHRCAVNTCLNIPNSSPVVNGTQIGTTGCYCVAGYIVNATNDGCVPETPCTSDTDCSQGYYCNPTTEKCAVNTCLSIPNSSPVVNGTQIGTTGCYCKFGYTANTTGTKCIEASGMCKNIIAVSNSKPECSGTKTTECFKFSGNNISFTGSVTSSTLAINNDLDISMCNLTVNNAQLSIYKSMKVHNLTIQNTLCSSCAGLLMTSGSSLEANDIDIDTYGDCITSGRNSDIDITAHNIDVKSSQDNGIDTTKTTRVIATGNITAEGKDSGIWAIGYMEAGGYISVTGGNEACFQNGVKTGSYLYANNTGNRSSNTSGVEFNGGAVDIGGNLTAISPKGPGISISDVESFHVGGNLTSDGLSGLTMNYCTGLPMTIEGDVNMTCGDGGTTGCFFNHANMTVGGNFTAINTDTDRDEHAISCNTGSLTVQGNLSANSTSDKAIYVYNNGTLTVGGNIDAIGGTDGINVSGSVKTLNGYIHATGNNNGIKMSNQTSKLEAHCANSQNCCSNSCSETCPGTIVASGKYYGVDNYSTPNVIADSNFFAYNSASTGKPVYAPKYVIYNGCTNIQQ